MFSAWNRQDFHEGCVQQKGKNDFSCGSSAYCVTVCANAECVAGVCLTTSSLIWLTEVTADDHAADSPSDPVASVMTLARTWLMDATSFAATPMPALYTDSVAAAGLAVLQISIICTSETGTASGTRPYFCTHATCIDVET
uniref:Uncharacterized protein n=1 Tax=Eutreptiella gymnastica TaxID=73025 RepID=A0A7S1NB42_9EUGL|mmetsp:Transcript_145136/g.253164  ORF Transcript_145136/g.253164 Transcript_145136/m.253164 type:complete len:141 (+) Transcript_145136:411-833(+)